MCVYLHIHTQCLWTAKINKGRSRSRDWSPRCEATLHAATCVPGWGGCVSINHTYCFLVCRYMSTLESFSLLLDDNKKVVQCRAASIVGILKSVHHQSFRCLRPWLSCLIWEQMEVWQHTLLDNVHFSFLSTPIVSLLNMKSSVLQRKVPGLLSSSACCSELNKWKRMNMSSSTCVTVCVCAFLLQPCWPADLMSSSVATVPAFTAPSSATRCTTVWTTATSQAASTVSDTNFLPLLKKKCMFQYTLWI